MREIIKTDLFTSSAPYEWALVGNDTLYTVHIPINDDGKVVDGGIEAQSKQCFDNLFRVLKSANCDVNDVFQVMIYLTSREDLAGFNKVYTSYFKEPFPNRAAIIVAGLAREEMLVEIVVYANGLKKDKNV